MENSRTPGILFIFFTLLIDIIGFGLIIPVLPGILEQMNGGDLSAASRWGGLLMFTYAAMQFVFSPIIGGLSDAYGRRPIILASLFAFGIGASLAAVGFIGGLVQGVLSRRIIPALGERKSVTWGVFLYGLGFVLFAFASQGWMMYLFMIPFGFGGIAVPALQSIISTQVPGNEQGELQGGLTSLASLTSIIGPIVMTNLFSFFTSVQSPVHFAGAPFLLGAILCFLGLLWTKSVFKRL